MSVPINQTTAQQKNLDAIVLTIACLFVVLCLRAFCMPLRQQRDATGAKELKNVCASAV